MADATPFEALLTELETLLVVERQALRCLDREAITRAADEKLRLDAALTVAHLPPHTPALQERLERVQRDARINQILLAHARSCVQGMLQLLTGQQSEGPVARAGSAAPLPVAVNFRG